MALPISAQLSHSLLQPPSLGVVGDSQKMSKKPVILPCHRPHKDLLSHWAQSRSPPGGSVGGSVQSPSKRTGKFMKSELLFDAGNETNTKLKPSRGGWNLLAHTVWRGYFGKTWKEGYRDGVPGNETGPWHRQSMSLSLFLSLSPLSLHQFLTSLFSPQLHYLPPQTGLYMVGKKKTASTYNLHPLLYFHPKARESFLQHPSINSREECSLALLRSHAHPSGQLLTSEESSSMIGQPWVICQSHWPDLWSEEGRCRNFLDSFLSEK